MPKVKVKDPDEKWQILPVGCIRKRWIGEARPAYLEIEIKYHFLPTTASA